MKTELSQRELEIAKLFALGYGGTEIAEILFLSTKTIESHKRRIRVKLGLDTSVKWMQYLRSLPGVEAVMA